jgi:toxin-antitoxin system PIN domain toxin
VSDAPCYLLDVNVVIALTNPSHVHHQRAHQWFAGVKAWATTAITEAAFIRLMLNPAVAGRSATGAEVLSLLAALRAWPGHRFISDDSSLSEPAIDLVGLVGHRQVTDLHLVNLAARSGTVLATFDTAISGALIGADQQWVKLV